MHILIFSQRYRDEAKRFAAIHLAFARWMKTADCNLELLP